MADNERLGGKGIEKAESLSENAAELRANLLKNKSELEKNPNNRAERMEGARNELEKQYQHENQGNTSKQPKQALPTAKPLIKKATKNQRKVEYKKTLRSIQKDMTPAERTFSKVLHNPAVEATSEVTGKTIARPAAIIAGSATALILTAVVYIIAKHYGYVLSGFEWIATFVIGWLIGLIIDWIRVAVLGKRAGPA